MIKIVADEHIPFLQGALEPYATVVYAPANAIDAAAVRDADALLVRTRTACNAALLAGSRVKFIGTATIGTDHIDTEYCRQQGIAVASAAGCNAAAVMQYVARTLVAIAAKWEKPLAGLTLGIVGVGHVGRLVRECAGRLGLHTLCNDPPLAAQSNSSDFIALGELLPQADIVTLHVPLDHSTKGLAGTAFFEQLKTGAAFINTSRGEVPDEVALLHHRSRLGFVALDVWRNEPHININLLQAADIATPHIAGYSIQGKRNATTMAVQALARFFGIDALAGFSVKIKETETVIDFADPKKADLQISENYAIFEDDKQLRNAPQHFEQLRNRYPYRNEFKL